jgi:hypothetical protein
MEKDNTFEMLRVIAKRNVQAAWLRVAAAAIIAIAWLTWFWTTLGGMVNLVTYVAILIACLIIASQVRNLSHARARARKLLPVLVVMALSGAHAAGAQELNAANCPQLMTIERSRQEIESIRAQREAAIDRLPTAQHQRLALESLYRWYWPRLARLEEQRRQVEGYCYRGAQVRPDYGATRVAPLPQYQNQRPQYQNPYPTDPFSSGDPRFAPPMYPYQGGWTYSPYANQTRVYPPYRSRRGGTYDPGALPRGGYDPFAPNWSR